MFSCRYMQIREQHSSTHSLGFRIEAVKVCSQSVIPYVFNAMFSCKRRMNRASLTRKYARLSMCYRRSMNTLASARKSNANNVSMVFCVIWKKSAHALSRASFSSLMRYDANFHKQLHTIPSSAASRQQSAVLLRRAKSKCVSNRFRQGNASWRSHAQSWNSMGDGQSRRWLSHRTQQPYSRTYTRLDKHLKCNNAQMFERLQKQRQSDSQSFTDKMRRLAGKTSDRH